MMGTDKELRDEELNRLLAAASEPRMSSNFEARLMQRIASHASATVIPFPGRTAVKPRRFPVLPLGIALAASLTLGFWLGGQGQISSLLDEGISATAMLTTGTDFAPDDLDDLLAPDSQT